MDHRGDGALGRADVESVGLDHPEAEVLERRHHVAQHEHPARREDLEARDLRSLRIDLLQDRLLHARTVQHLEMIYVGHGGPDVDRGPILAG